MDRAVFTSYVFNERSQVAVIKREVQNIIKPVFGENRGGEINIAVAEMLSNVLKHASGGEFLCRLTRKDDKPFFEVLCIDSGPGIRDLTYASKDGVSSKQTLGHGLGAISRLSSFSQIYSQVGWGTICYSNFSDSAERRNDVTKETIRYLNVSLPGETVSGDGAEIRYLEDKTMIFAADGLGHGIHAKEAVDKACAVFSQSSSSDPARIIQEMHLSLKKSRGLVGTVAVMDNSSKNWEICGIGNILTRLQRGLEFRNYICNNGIIGLNIPTRLDNAVWPMEKFQILIFCSDGLKTRWDLAKYPSILKYDPIIIAAALYKDHTRRTDDMSVLVIKVA